MRKAISVLKNRSGAHEDFVRELRIDAAGIRIGAPFTELRGVLTGTPEYVGVGHAARGTPRCRLRRTANRSRR